MTDLREFLEDELEFFHPGRPGWLHPKTWSDQIMPLWEFPEHRAQRVVDLALGNKKPPRWIGDELMRMESRAWHEWHWVRGQQLRRDETFTPRWRRSIPDSLRRRVYDRDGHACLHCGTSEALSLDHIYPHSLGGEDVYENLQTLCRPCNSRKGARV